MFVAVNVYVVVWVGDMGSGTPDSISLIILKELSLILAVPPNR